MAKNRLSSILLFVTLVYLQNNFLHSNAEDVSAEETPIPAVKEEKNVIILTKNNFDHVLRNAPIHIVNIYADRCAKCHQVMPEYEKAAAALKAENSPVKFIKLEAESEPELSVGFGADTYPKLKASKNGKFWEYEGATDAQAIADYMRQVATDNFQIPPDPVISLSAETFAAVVSGHQLMLVEFYAPWCQHCQRLAPIYEKAAKELSRRSPPILLAKVDVTSEINKPLGEQYNVKAFPDLRIFRFGKDSPYNGEKMKVEDIVNYMETQRGDGSKEKSTIEEMNAAMSEDQVTIVAFIADRQSKQYAAYIDITNRMRDDYVLYHTFNESVAQHFQADVNSVVLFHAPRFHTAYEPKRFSFPLTETTEAENLQTFIYRNHNPLVGQFTQKTVNMRYLMRPLVLFFYTVDFSNEGVRHTQFWRQRIAAIAKDYQPMNTTFAIVNEEDFPEFTASFGIEESGEAINVGILGKGSKRYLMTPMEEWDPEAIRHFISQYHQGKLKNHVKSQIAPSKLSGNVKIVVGNTFEQVVLDPTKEVLIQMHQPKCEMCKTLEPIYKHLASKYSKVKDLVIAKIDVLANDVPDEYRVKMLPSLFFVPKSNEPIKFEGMTSTITLEALESFISLHATVDLGELRVKVEKDEL